LRLGRRPGEPPGRRVNARPGGRADQAVRDVVITHVNEVIEIDGIGARASVGHQRKMLQHAFAGSPLEDPVARESGHRLKGNVETERGPRISRHRSRRRGRSAGAAIHAHPFNGACGSAVGADGSRGSRFPDAQPHFQRLAGVNVELKPLIDAHRRVGERRRVVGGQPHPGIGFAGSECPLSLEHLAGAPASRGHYRRIISRGGQKTAGRAGVARVAEHHRPVHSLRLITFKIRNGLGRVHFIGVGCGDTELQQ